MKQLSQVALSNLRNKAIVSKKSDLQKVESFYTIPSNPKIRELLARLVMQEALETVNAFGFHPQSLDDRENFVLTPIEKELDIYEIIDGCCDVDYVVRGALVAMGVPDEPHINEVCRANDEKFPNGEAILNEVGKYQKPPGWKPPDHEKVKNSVNKIDLLEFSNKLLGKEKFTMFLTKPFSQWAFIGFEIDGVWYNTAEQWMMVCKASHFGDEESLKKIMEADHPGEQKRLGRLVKNFNKEEWEKYARDYVTIGNLAKYSQNSEAREALFATAGTTLVETNPNDSIWGIGLSSDDPEAWDRNTWKGLNWLGEVLTYVRDFLMEKEREGKLEELTEQIRLGEYETRGFFSGSV